MARILLVDDDPSLLDALALAFTDEGHLVATAADGAQALAAIRTDPPDAVVSDINMPGIDGFTVCRKLRSAGNTVPIILLTSRDSEIDETLGLELGADDYVAKPYSPRELLARIRAVVRRAKGRAGPAREAVKVGGLVVDPAARRVVLDGREIVLTGYEFALLLALARRAGRVLGREQLMELAKGSADDAFDRSIDVHVSRLRQKLGDDPKRPRLIKTVRGAGYVLAGEAE